MELSLIQIAFLLGGPVLAVASLAYLSWRTSKLTVDDPASAIAGPATENTGIEQAATPPKQAAAGAELRTFSEAMSAARRSAVAAPVADPFPLQVAEVGVRKPLVSREELLRLAGIEKRDVNLGTRKVVVRDAGAARVSKGKPRRTTTEQSGSNPKPSDRPTTGKGN